MTVGALNALDDLNVRCPDDISLATFDHLTVDSTSHAHLNALVQPSYEMGARAATLLMDRIEGTLTGDPIVVRVASTFVVRESTRRLLPFEIDKPLRKLRRSSMR